MALSGTHPACEFEAGAGDIYDWPGHQPHEPDASNPDIINHGEFRRCCFVGGCLPAAGNHLATARTQLTGGGDAQYESGNNESDCAGKCACANRGAGRAVVESGWRRDFFERA